MARYPSSFPLSLHSSCSFCLFPVSFIHLPVSYLLCSVSFVLSPFFLLSLFSFVHSPFSCLSSSCATKTRKNTVHRITNTVLHFTRYYEDLHKNIWKYAAATGGAPLERTKCPFFDWEASRTLLFRWSGFTPFCFSVGRVRSSDTRLSPVGFWVWFLCCLPSRQGTWRRSSILCQTKKGWGSAEVSSITEQKKGEENHRPHGLYSNHGKIHETSTNHRPHGLYSNLHGLYSYYRPHGPNEMPWTMARVMSTSILLPNRSDVIGAVRRHDRIEAFISAFILTTP